MKAKKTTTNATAKPHTKLPCFTAYDLRGELGTHFNADTIYLAARGFVEITGATTCAVGHDVRESSTELYNTVIRGLHDAGCSTLALGLCGTEEVYHAAMHFNLGGGLMVTASHNPITYNGLKLVKHGAAAFTPDKDMPALHAYMQQYLSTPPAPVKNCGQQMRVKENPREAYIQHLRGYIDTNTLSPLTIVVNGGNGAVGPAFAALKPYLPFNFIELNMQPDSSFPKGIPNPLLKENRTQTINAVLEHKADLGIAWDGDFDRCTLFDSEGTFVNAYYLIGLLAEEMLRAAPNTTIIHDPRQFWNTQAVAKKYGATTHTCRCGHGYFKVAMKETEAIFGAENSGHYFFRNFGGCDTGMVPWLLATAIISRTGKSLAELIATQRAQFPASEEINMRLGHDAADVLAAVEKHFTAHAMTADKTDGLSMACADWRFNLRRSSNEKELVRLNLEATTADMLAQKQAELENLLHAIAHKAA